MASFIIAASRSDPSQWLFYTLICLLLIGSPFVIPFVVLGIFIPIKQWRKPLITVDPDLQPTDADHFTPEMLDFLSPILPQFLALGFEVTSNLENQKSVPNARSVQLLLANRTTQESATIVLTQALLNRNFVYAFTTRFADETEIQTGVNSTIGYTPKNPRFDALAIPSVPDVAALLEFHRRRVQHVGRQNDPRVVPPPGQEIAHIIEVWHRQTAHWESLGYCYRDPTAHTFRRTLKGAFLTTWKMIPSIRRWRIRRRDRKSNRIWQELGMNEWLANRPASAIAAPTPPPLPATATAQQDLPVDELHYEAELQPGEIRQQFAPDGVIIRMGRQSTKSYFIRHLVSLIFILIYIYIIANSLFTIWMWRQIAPYAANIFLSHQIKWLALLVILGGLQAYRYLRGFAFTGGTAMLTATPAGLRFHNVPFRKREGFIPRQELRGLYIIKTFSGFRRIYRLMAAHRTGRQYLLTGPNRTEFLQISTTLATALGITLPAPDPQPSVPPMLPNQTSP